jgi:hypothetical protein
MTLDMLIVQPNLFMGWSAYLIFDILCPLVRVKIEMSSLLINSSIPIGKQFNFGRQNTNFYWFLPMKNNRWKIFIFRQSSMKYKYIYFIHYIRKEGYLCRPYPADAS